MMTVATASGDGAGGVGTSNLGRRARIGYLIMLSGVEELQKTKRLLKVGRTSTGDDIRIRTRESFLVVQCLVKVSTVSSAGKAVRLIALNH